ncbi:MAG: putative alpha/beta-hydrolase fold family hydrolase [Elusimicrobia bacterium]|nr:MAG: putative alpha/beta-hydrolase fold family hydrolase [Elusimicrobiota bacterium]
MPLATLPSGLRLAYESRGRGETLLLIAGLGRDRRMWDAQVPSLSERNRVVTFDNRGVGESEKPAGPYTAAQMAADASGLLDVLEVETALVAGASLGGLIAQELALSRPERVSRLALLCTHPGQPLCVPMDRNTLAGIVPDPAADPFERLLGAMRLAYGPRYWERHAASLAEAARARLGFLPSVESWWAQAAAGASFSWSGRRISAPTLVLTGDEDRIVPPANSATLSRLIPGSRVEVFPGAGHYFFCEQPEAVNRALLGFFAVKSQEEAWLSPA